MLSSMLLFFSGQDTLIIMLVALVLFGGKKLPELAKGLGQGIREFKDASEGVKRDIQEQINKETEKKDTPAANTTLTPDPAAPVNHPGATPVQDTSFHADPAAPAPETHTTLPPDTTAPGTNHPRETPL